MRLRSIMASAEGFQTRFGVEGSGSAIDQHRADGFQRSFSNFFCRLAIWMRLPMANWIMPSSDDS